MTVEMVNDAGGPKLRGSIALCSMTGGNAATGASEAHVIHPTIVNDGSPHDFIFEKGSPGTNLAPGCVSVNVDSGTAEEACNSERSWAESDTLYVNCLLSLHHGATFDLRPNPFRSLAPRGTLGPWGPHSKPGPTVEPLQGPPWATQWRHLKKFF